MIIVGLRHMTTQYLLLYIMPTNTVSISSVQILRSQYYISLYQVSILYQMTFVVFLWFVQMILGGSSHLVSGL